MDRILIELTGSLPEDNKFATLATAQSLAVAIAADLKEKHKLDLAVSVRPIKESAPRAKKATPIVAPVPMEAGSQGSDDNGSSSVEALSLPVGINPQDAQPIPHEVSRGMHRPPRSATGD